MISISTNYESPVLWIKTYSQSQKTPNNLYSSCKIHLKSLNNNRIFAWNSQDAQFRIDVRESEDHGK